MELLATFQFHFDIPRVEVSHEQDLVFISIKNEEGMAVTSVDRL
jgi:hypothetical protein